MEPRSRTLDIFLPRLIALALIGILFVLSLQPTLSDQESKDLASRFRFDKLPLPELPDYSYDRKVREVHPSLYHIRSQVSFIGAAVALADLDGDGFPNDVVYVDPRVDLVIVAPAPGAKPRYAPFALDPGPMAYSTSTMAPMGCLVGDFNEDGWPDILVYYWGRSPILFMQRPDAANPGGVALTRQRFVPCELVEPYQRWYTGAVTQADLDGDGHVDLVIGNYYPDGARILDAAATGVESMPHSLSRAFNGGRGRMFLWQGPGENFGLAPQFREAQHVLADEVAGGWTLALGTADLDGDLLPEIYFAQDFGPDRLLHNRSKPGALEFALLHGERTLTTPRSRVLGYDTFNGMGVDFGDLNGDGVFDIVVSNTTCNFAFQESNFVYLSNKNELHRMREGIAPYCCASEELGLSRGGWTWDVKLADFDNDGVVEVMQAAGYLKGTVNRWPELTETGLTNDELTVNPRGWHSFQPGDDVAGSDHNPFFVRAKDGRYYDLAHKIGLAEPMLSRGIATADVDGDGRLDFAVANQWGPSFFFRNTSPNAGAYLGLNLRLPAGARAGDATVVRPGHPERWREGPSRPALGATATVHLPDGRRLLGQVDGGTGHSGKRSPDLHFGLGRVDATDPVRVDLRWRGADGRVRSHTLHLRPGWHTVLLGEAPPGKAGSQP